MFRRRRNEKRLVSKTLFCFWLRQNELPNPKPSRFLFATRSVAIRCKMGLWRAQRSCRAAKPRGNLFPKCGNCKFAEGMGFEPMIPCGILAFQASALDHYANPPFDTTLKCVSFYYKFYPTSARILSSTGGCVINIRVRNFFFTLFPNGFAINRCAVASFAFFIGAPCILIFCNALANPFG